MTGHTVPYGTDLFPAVALAVNCQATITGSLRDKDLPTPVHEIDSTPALEDEDDDEYEDENVYYATGEALPTGSGASALLAPDAPSEMGML